MLAGNKITDPKTRRFKAIVEIGALGTILMIGGLIRLIVTLENPQPNATLGQTLQTWVPIVGLVGIGLLLVILVVHRSPKAKKLVPHSKAS